VIVVCPITNRSRRWPFQVAISPVGKITGFVLVDQIQAIDPIARACRFAGVVSEATLSEVRRRLASLIQGESRA
jgi:mRNA interferase MazF